ncbi:MAG TPA: T9SS type A sorting domain-containing protein, partial [Bacteroidota bacterium]
EFSGVRQEILVGVQDSAVYIWNAEDTNNDGAYDTVRTTVVILSQRITTAPSFAVLSLVYSIVVGGEKGTVWEIGVNGTIQREYSVSQPPVASVTQLPNRQILSRPTRLYYTSGSQLFSDQLSFQLGDGQQPWLVASTVMPRGNVVIAAEEGGSRLVAVDENFESSIFQAQTSGESITALSAGDIDLDGSKDFLVSAGKKLYAFNKTGAPLDGYPVQLLAASFAGSPLIGDIDGDGRTDVVSLTSSGTVLAYDDKGRLKAGFPLQTIAGEGHIAFFQTPGNKLGLVATSKSGEMQAWELGATFDPAALQWSQHLHDAQHTNSDQVVLQSTEPKSAEFFPKSLVYNWPNPVYGSTTQIRYYVSEDADVKIKIFDLVGSKITELSSRAVGGIDNELTWDVSGIQSGVYLAHVEVTGAARSESAVIKIAVIK